MNARENAVASENPSRNAVSFTEAFPALRWCNASLWRNSLSTCANVTPIHGYASLERKTYSVIALAFMILVAGTTSIVHFVELTALRQLGTAGLVWPSVAYAAELLAWNLFLGLSLLFAAPVFEGGGLARGVRRGLYLSGALCVAGVIGPAAGNMRRQLVGILGYAGVFPVVCFMLSRLFRADTRPA